MCFPHSAVNNVGVYDEFPDRFANVSAKVRYLDKLLMYLSSLLLSTDVLQDC